MGKKNKRKNDNEEMDFHDDGGGEDFPVPYPTRFEREVLATMEEEELHKLGRMLADSIDRVSRMNLNPYPWEIEMCYVQQEMQVRQARREAHHAWLLSRGGTEPVSAVS